VQVLEAKKRILGEEHPDTLITETILAMTKWDLGRLDEAEELLVHTSQTSETVLGAEHPDTINSNRWLTELREDAEDTKVYQGHELNASEDHSKTRLNNLKYLKTPPRKSRFTKLFKKFRSRFRSS
jgi:hypothetical protein